MEADWFAPVNDRAALDYIIGSVHYLRDEATGRYYAWLLYTSTERPHRPETPPWTAKAGAGFARDRPRRRTKGASANGCLLYTSRCV